MNIIQAKENKFEKYEMYEVFNDVLIKMEEQDNKVMIMDADLMAAVKTEIFADKYPERSINCGVQEANMLGVAAGLSLEGFKPYVHTFTPFCTRRALDQIWVSCAYAKANVKIVGSDPGIMATLNGGTHMSFEDVGIMRMVPGIVIIEPTDSVVLKDMLMQTKDIYGIIYIRLQRKKAMKIYEKGSKFDIGKAVKLREGKDISIITGGICVYEALRAHEILKEHGIQASVLDMISIKPIDKEAVINEARDTGLILTCENHNIINGLGSAVAEVVAEEASARLLRMGINEKFGEVGDYEYLKKRFRLRGEDIAETAIKLLRIS